MRISHYLSVFQPISEYETAHVSVFERNMPAYLSERMSVSYSVFKRVTFSVSLRMAVYLAIILLISP